MTQPELFDPSDWEREEKQVSLMDASLEQILRIVAAEASNIPPGLVDLARRKIWSMSDAYITKPTYKHFDWSGIRDSSPEAKRRMAMAVQRMLFKAGIRSVNLVTEHWKGAAA